MAKILVSHWGLTERDLLLIRNLLSLSVEWFGHLELAPKAGRTGGQIMLIDLDRPDAHEACERMRLVDSGASIISISAHKNRCLPNSISLQRPLVFRRLSEALNSISADKSSTSVQVDKQSRILVVDDSAPVCTFMTQKLHALISPDTSIDIASDGGQGVSLANRHNYDLVFMDVMMPGMDGYRACRLIKHINANTKVVMLTGKSSALNRVKAKMSSCDGYITKPPQDKELLKAVREYLPQAPVREHTGFATGMTAYR
ncbi:response regulator [Allohahella sp. A8]|uniref:response regulator n=1 Tax=Allohahella sp. A8 TaxID=3141461 RepID=UPI003A80CAB9